MLWPLLNQCSPGAPRQLPCLSIPIRAETWQLITLGEATGPTLGSTQARPQVKREATRSSQSPAQSSCLPTPPCPPCSRPLRCWGQGKRDGCWWAPVPQTWQGGFCPFPLTLGLPSQNDWGYPWGTRAISGGSQPSAPPPQEQGHEATGKPWAMGHLVPVRQGPWQCPGLAQPWRPPSGASLSLD